MKVRAVMVWDESGHQYLIPHDLMEKFFKDEEIAGETEVNSAGMVEYPEGSYSFCDFDDEWSKYMVEGEYEIYANFDDIV